MSAESGNQKPDLDLEKLKEGTAQFQQDRDVRRDQVVPFSEFLGLYGRGEAQSLLAGELVLRAMLSQKPERISEEERLLEVPMRFPVFKELYGTWEQTSWELYQFVRAGINDPQVTGRMGLAIISPPGSGKTTYIGLLSRAMERVSEKLRLYELKGCPLHHSPFWIVPRYLRVKTWDPEKAAKVGFNEPFEKRYNIAPIAGDLCVVCRHELKTKYHGAWWDFPVAPFTLSIQGRRGFGEFKPSNERNSDITVLGGAEVLGVTQDPKRGRSDPFAYDIGSGVIAQASGGLLHGIEMFMEGNDVSMHRVLLSIMSDKQFLVEGSSIPAQYVDTYVVFDANLRGYKWFDGLAGEEALHDRIHFVFNYYNLDWREEVKIYRKLIANEQDFRLLAGCHMDPMALELAARFAVLTRFAESKLVKSFSKQMELYADESILKEEGSDREISKEDLLKEGRSAKDITKRSGMFGASPRMVVSALTNAVASEEEKGCLTLRKVIRALRGIMDDLTKAGITTEERERMRGYLEPGGSDSIFTIMNEKQKRVVHKAFIRTHSDLSASWFKKYMEEDALWCSVYAPIHGVKTPGKKKDVLGERREPDEKHLKKIETHWDPPVIDAQRMVHRVQQLRAKETFPSFGYGHYAPLTEACDAALLAEGKSLLLVVISPDEGLEEADKEVVGRRKSLRELLLSNDSEAGGHCNICANEKTEEVYKLLSK